MIVNNYNGAHPSVRTLYRENLISLKAREEHEKLNKGQGGWDTDSLRERVQSTAREVKCLDPV